MTLLEREGHQQRGFMIAVADFYGMYFFSTSFSFNIVDTNSHPIRRLCLIFEKLDETFEHVAKNETELDGR